MDTVRFGIIGGGWRTEFYLRIARALPECFNIDGIVVRNADKGRLIEKTWGVSTYRSIHDFLKQVQTPFVVTAVPATVNAGVIKEVAEWNMPVLSETPAGPDLESMREIWRLTQQRACIQVAEQYIFQPHHAARLAFIQTGRLGAVSHVQISAAHGYHAMSLLRHFVGVQYENAVIQAWFYSAPVVDGPSRQGPPPVERIKRTTQVIALLNFHCPDGERLGIYDWADGQYFSWIRGQRLLVRGERGEIINTKAVYLADYATSVHLDFQRVNAGEEGNLEGFYLKGVMAGADWVYRNPVAPARLADDEIAVATSLCKMREHIHGGPPVYSWAEACQDRYLDLMIGQALSAGKAVTTETQVWVDKSVPSGAGQCRRHT